MFKFTPITTDQVKYIFDLLTHSEFSFQNWFPLSKISEVKGDALLFKNYFERRFHMEQITSYSIEKDSIKIGVITLNAVENQTCNVQYVMRDDINQDLLLDIFKQVIDLTRQDNLDMTFQIKIGRHDLGSQRLACKLNFKITGTLKEKVFSHDLKEEDLVLFQT